MPTLVACTRQHVEAMQPPRVPTRFSPAAHLRWPKSQWNQGPLATSQAQMCPRTANSGQAQLLDGLEAPHPQQVLLQRPDEPLRAAVALGLAHEGGRALEAEEADLGLAVVAHVLAAVIVAQPEAGGDGLGERAEALAHRLPDRLGRA